MNNETITFYYVRNISDRWEVWSSVEYVEKTFWRQHPFLNFVAECENEDEANKLRDRLNGQ